MKASLLLGFCLLLIPNLRAAGDTLADAVERRESFRIQALLSRDIDVDQAQVDGMTALHWAVYHDDVEMAKTLLQRGAKATVENRYSVTPLYLACLNGNPELVEELLRAGADPNTAMPGGETALMTAARTGVVGAVNALLEAGAEVEKKEWQGQTAIMWAAAQGHLEVVQTLLEAEADFLTPLKSGFTSLYFALREGHGDVVALLLDAGAEVNGAMNLDKPLSKGPLNGTSPLILAIENGHYDLAVDLLDAGADPDDRRTGFTPLHTLTWIRKPDIGESVRGAPPPRGSGKRNSEQFTRELVARGADVNARLTKGRRAGRGRVSQIGATAFFMAADRADLPYMKLLLELGADPFIPNEDGCTALMVAAGIGSTAPEEEAGTEMECLEAVKFLVSLGMDIDTVDANGETAMHGAAYKNAPAVARYLHEQGADIRIWNTKNKLERTPLLIAEGYRPGNFKPSFATVEAITEIMLAQNVEPPTGPKPKHSNYNF